MKVFVNYDEVTGDLKGFYTTDIHSEDNIPTPKIEITEEEWKKCLGNQDYKIDLDAKSLIYRPYIITLEEEKVKILKEIRKSTGELIDNRFKRFDRENLFVLENKPDINDYLTGERVGKQFVKDNILSIKTACNDLESQIESATTKEELELIDISQDNLKILAGWTIKENTEEVTEAP